MTSCDVVITSRLIEGVRLVSAILDCPLTGLHRVKISDNNPFQLKITKIIIISI